MSEKFHYRSNQLGENKKSRVNKSTNFEVFVVSDFERSDVDFRKSSSANSKVWIVTQMTNKKLCKSVQSARRTNIWKTIVLSRGHGTSSFNQNCAIKLRGHGFNYDSHFWIFIHLHCCIIVTHFGCIVYLSD